jgi:hypothetical protein
VDNPNQGGIPVAAIVLPNFWPHLWPLPGPMTIHYKDIHHHGILPQVGNQSRIGTTWHPPIFVDGVEGFSLMRSFHRVNGLVGIDHSMPTCPVGNIGIGHLCTRNWQNKSGHSLIGKCFLSKWQNIPQRILRPGIEFFLPAHKLMNTIGHNPERRCIFGLGRRNMPSALHGNLCPNGKSDKGN